MDIGEKAVKYGSWTITAGGSVLYGVNHLGRDIMVSDPNLALIGGLAFTIAGANEAKEMLSARGDS